VASGKNRDRGDRDASPSIRRVESWDIAARRVSRRRQSARTAEIQWECACPPGKRQGLGLAYRHSGGENVTYATHRGVRRTANPSALPELEPEPMPKSALSPVRVLGTCGLASAAFSTLAGFFNFPALLGVAGALMLAGNAYAIARGGGR
jgi:hypothetical protein